MNNKKQRELSMDYCNNCGRGSHCGVPVMEDFRREPYNHGIEGQICVCKYCMCGRCATK
jgi:hypothetical protein